MDTFDTNTPIYMQIMARINRKIVRSEWRAGDKLPSVREMAIQSSVNPNTIQRAYRELERMNIVETRRGQGTFITEDEETLLQLRRTLKAEHISTFVKDMREMGFSNEEMLSGIEYYFKHERENGGEET
ncbi:GntR family transcriptional regulator [Pueribacillus sp. YX66]|uniref:GntR family transcriptional regulator n=1 Tax=Pueribacillus sp. YX66 TaxID=3229242 RepID=UPI00358D56F7